MEVIDQLRRQFSFDAWANREVLANIRAHGTDARSCQLTAHILSAQRLWLERLRRQPQTLPVWPDFDIDACEKHAAELAHLWREYLGGLDSVRLSTPISYKNSKGELWTNSVVDILTHVIMHSVYHRGQIASHMRASGKAPAYTDYIHAVRQNLTE